MMPAYWGLFAAGWLGLTAGWWRLRNRAAPDWKPPTAALVVLGVALLLRLPFVLWTEPVLSTDIWRYLHDGRVLSRGENPYALSPMEWSAWERTKLEEPDGSPRHTHITDRINNPTLVTIYQPVSQYLFAALTPAGLWRPAWNRVFRAVFVGFDLAIVGVLMLGLRWQGRSPWWAALYAWHPLAVTEFAWSGHQDVIGILPLVGAAVMMQRMDRTRAPEPRMYMRGFFAGALFALAVAVKPVVAPMALPLAVIVGRAKPQAVAVAAGACGVTLVGLYLPFVLMEGGLSGMLATAREFTSGWVWNGSAHALLHAISGEKRVSDWLCGVALLVVLVAVTLRSRDVVSAAMLYLFAALLLSSTVHPWYLLWVLALLPLCPGGPGAWAAPAVWVFSLTIGWSYAAILRDDFHPPAWVVWLEYVPVYAALGWAVWRLRGAASVRHLHQ